MRNYRVVLAAALLLFGSACGDDGDDDAATGSGNGAPSATSVDVTATDFAFEVPSTIPSGVVEMNYRNSGAEPHFAAFAKIADGKTFADAKTALTASGAPSGPPPFVEWAGSPTADPGGTGKLSFDLPAGTYALFCAIPSADGVSHAAKGMVTEVTVTEPETDESAELPDAVGTITATDFALTAVPELDEGENTVKLVNNGKQLHEINLIELPAGKTVDDVRAWHEGPAGPPPNRSLSGVAVAQGEEGTATFTLKKGSTYAFVCVIPDSLGDFKPHISKGMATGAFTV